MDEMSIKEYSEGLRWQAGYEGAAEAKLSYLENEIRGLEELLEDQEGRKILYAAHAKLIQLAARLLWLREQTERV